MTDPSNPTRTSRRRPGLRVKLLALLVGLVIALVCAEVFARVVYERPWHQELVDEALTAHELPYRRNALGLRDEEVVSPKPAGERRVLVLGDSFTYGYGVADDGAVFPALLEAKLDGDAKRFGADGIELLNAGVPGTLTGDWLEGFRALAPVFDPDVVVIVFFLRDGTRTHSIPEFFGKIRDQITARNRASWLYGWSYLWRLVQDRMDRQLISDEYLAAFQRSYFGTEEERSEWRLAKQNLKTIRDEAEQRGAEVGFVVFPILVELTDDYPFAAICTEIETWARGEGLPTLSLLPAYRGRKGPELWVSRADQHPNALGHRIAYEALLPFFEQLLEK